MLYKRPQEEVPDEHSLRYPAELEGSFLPVTDSKFECQFSSASFPGKDMEKVEPFDTNLD